MLDEFDQLYKAFLHCPLVLSSAPSINTATSENFCEEKKRWSHDSSPGRLGVEREHYHCVMPTPPPKTDKLFLGKTDREQFFIDSFKDAVFYWAQSLNISCVSHQVKLHTSAHRRRVVRSILDFPHHKMRLIFIPFYLFAILTLLIMSRAPWFSGREPDL